MNWEAVGALAELIGAVAVVASLIYLARQLKMTRQVEQVSALQAVFDGFTHHAACFFAAPDDLALRGLRDRSTLGTSERLQFDQLLENILNQGETTGALISAGLMNQDDVAPLDWWLEHKLFRYPGAREWLEEFAPAYPPAYVVRLREAASRGADQRQQGLDNEPRSGSSSVPGRRDTTRIAADNALPRRSE